MKKWIVLFLVLIAAAISIFVYVSTGSEKPFYNDINLTQYQKEVDSKKPKFIYVYETSCPPCQEIKPELNEVIKKEKLKVQALNIEEKENYNTDFLDKYNLNKTPTILYYKDGKEKDRLEGYRSASQIEKFFEKNGDK
ncbi:disulfide bond formation protein BdbA [Bacillus inaquosorum]|uniref:disulfide bond formation protein BdbA n=1 Tax=Bacillus inaquosorum TaxID=483913 RepID=UPI000745CE9E|nr:disulfide bond formation protein BdbA [Bacillus inaquosorum]PPA37833.1 thioredoxin [Bacillus subtilis]AMA52593.1 disulfide bond formation protein DsbA [Bacillus inaquosorum]MBT3124202.1 disulfide bond formation protein BdbA [Bacillus inaquosorum]MCY8377336.1 disulfide bond formation protein BdbA [Bacillus inaquosorum]MCY9011545.1 disulfide bond formation protein BdbA [Bacillus inaquosorum]